MLYVKIKKQPGYFLNLTCALLHVTTQCAQNPVPPFSDYLGTHQCSKNAKLGGFEQSLNVHEFGKKGVLL